MSIKRELAQGTQNVSRVFTILREVAAYSREGMRLVDVARRLNIEIPTAHRILKCLLEERALRRDEHSKRYFLGQALFEFGIAATPRIDLRALSAPALERLAEETGDMIFLTSRSGLDGICLSRKEGKFPVRTYTLEVGMRRPLGVGAGSLALLAMLPEDEIKEIINSNVERLRDYDSLTDVGLLSQVRRTQKQGFSLRDLRGLGGVRTIGVSINTVERKSIAALSLSAIRSRMKDERVSVLVALLHEEAKKLGQQLSEAHELV